MEDAPSETVPAAPVAEQAPAKTEAPAKAAPFIWGTGRRKTSVARVRLRVGETLYELRAERADEDADREAFWAAVKRKYDYEPDPEQMEGGLSFRLVAR